MLKHIFNFLLITVDVIIATHFRGGTISWNAKAGSASVQFHFRLAWELGRGGCDGTNKGAYVTSLSMEKWLCTSGCPGQPEVGDNSYYCTEVDVLEGWEQGEKRLSYNFRGPGPFTVGYSGRNWMPFNYGISGQWNLETSIDLRPRSDSMMPNRSPVTSSLPVYTLPFGCSTVIRIPVFDQDSDTLKCRWSRGSECGSICTNVPSIPSGQLDETACTLTLDVTTTNNYTDGGMYAVALTIEDFPNTSILLNGVAASTSKALSSIPLQFLMNTVLLPSVCSHIPTFTDTPLDGTTFVIPDGKNWSLRVYIQGHGGAVPDHIIVSGPHNLKRTALQQDDRGRPDIKFSDLAWSPTVAEKGVNILCFKAIDDNGMPSDQRCFILLAGAPDPCASNPCVHGGTCSIHFDTYVCTCQRGITGNNCEVDIDECKQLPCENGGICSNTVGSFQCFCLQGFTGLNCSETDHCDSNPCRHGKCLQKGNTYTCICSSGFTGVYCETDVDDCMSAPCSNGAICSDMVDDYFCDCPISYGGKNCDQVIDFCFPLPCKHEGWCESFGDSYACHCREGYTGLNCELPDHTVCGADESHCTCIVDGKPVKVSFPEPYHDNRLARDLTAGIIGYPIGLALGAIGCALYHYFIRRGCSKSGSYTPRRRPGSSSSTAPLTPPPEMPVTPTNIQPNIYRSGFHDDTIFKTGDKMDDNSYITAKRDW